MNFDHISVVFSNLCLLSNSRTVFKFTDFFSISMFLKVDGQWLTSPDWLSAPSCVEIERSDKRARGKRASRLLGWPNRGFCVSASLPEALIRMGGLGNRLLPTRVPFEHSCHLYGSGHLFGSHCFEKVLELS